MLNITCGVMRHFELAPIPQMQPVAGFLDGLHIALYEAFDGFDDKTGEPAEIA